MKKQTPFFLNLITGRKLVEIKNNKLIDYPTQRHISTIYPNTPTTYKIDYLNFWYILNLDFEIIKYGKKSRFKPFKAPETKKMVNGTSINQETPKKQSKSFFYRQYLEPFQLPKIEELDF